MRHCSLLPCGRVFDFIREETEAAGSSLKGLKRLTWTDTGEAHVFGLDSPADDDEIHGGAAPASSSAAGAAPAGGTDAGAATHAASGGDDGDRVPRCRLTGESRPPPS